MKSLIVFVQMTNSEKSFSPLRDGLILVCRTLDWAMAYNARNDEIMDNITREEVLHRR
jgi:hypothetical protein